MGGWIMHLVDGRSFKSKLVALIFIVMAAVVRDDAVAADVGYDFRPQTVGAYGWLAAQGFEFKIDAANTSRARIGLTEKGLTIETLTSAEPLIARSGLRVAQPAQLAITWGVDRYPAGANWD